MTSVVAVVLLLAGCGSSQQESSPSDTATDTSPETTAEAAAPEEDTAGEMFYEYEEATSPEAINGKKIMEDAGLLEFLAADANEGLVFPFDIPLIGAQCDEANAFWSPSDQQMVICYEDVDLAEQIFIEDGDADPVDSALNTEVATFYHELGHMAVDIYDLPSTGRQEDVADQLAAFILLQPDDNGQLDPESVKTLIDFSREFDGYAAMDDGAIREEYLSDVHSLNQTRSYNLLCWAYGADPEGNADIMTSGRLPEARAEVCEDEYTQMDKAWFALLEPHLK
jgi:Putative metallopeptidase